MSVIIIGIAGASGSGKTTVALGLNQHYGDEQCVVISSDNYYKSLSGLSPEEKGEVNFDHPDSLDLDLLHAHLCALKGGNSIEMPHYDFATSERTATTTQVEPKKIIIVEGILILSHQGLKELFDTKVFIRTAMDLCFIRRLLRDTKERGQTHEQVIAQYQRDVRPMYEEFVKPCAREAHVLIENDDESMSLDFDLQPLIDHIETISQGTKFGEKQRFRLFQKQPPAADNAGPAEPCNMSQGAISLN